MAEIKQQQKIHRFISSISEIKLFNLLSEIWQKKKKTKAKRKREICRLLN